MGNFAPNRGLRPTIALLYSLSLMRRALTTFVLLYAVAAVFAPVAFAFTAPAPHACCIRAAHHCHEMASAENGLALRSLSCCGQDCGRAVTSAQWAHAQSSAVTAAYQTPARLQVPALSTRTNSEVARLTPSRAPPSL